MVPCWSIKNAPSAENGELKRRSSQRELFYTLQAERELLPDRISSLM